MADLMLCPFCGQKAHFRYRMPFYIIECKYCGYQISQPDYYEQADGKKALLTMWRNLHKMKEKAERSEMNGTKKQSI